MNKFGIVLGVAAVATLAGCKDPNYKRGADVTPQSQVKNIETSSNIETTSVEVAPVVPAKPVAPKCQCLPGMKHTEPCTCGDPNCKCIVETKPVVVAPSAVEPEYTIYTVQSGDYLAKISKKYNVTIASIKRLNPSIKKDVVRVGQKLKIPGKVEVPVAPVTVAAPASKTVAKKSTMASAYTGPTKEYVVKSGDTIGSIAYGNGINIRQLKALNGLTGDGVKVGQKIKIPAEKVVKPAKVAAAQTPVKASEPAKNAEVAQPVTPQAEKPAANADDAATPAQQVAPATPATTLEAAKPVAEAPVSANAAVKEEPKIATTTYVVREGDDMTGVSIRWGVSAAEIRELNNLAENDKLVPGQIIKLPAEAQQ